MILQGTLHPPGRSIAKPGRRDQGAGLHRGFLAGRRAIIAEDEGITQMQLRMILGRAGLDVVGSAMSGEQAVDLALRERPDLILMDIKMPGTVDGLEAARRVLRVYHPCIVMLTAYDEYEQMAHDIGAAAYVVKPIDFATLVPRLEEAMQRHQGQAH